MFVRCVFWAALLTYGGRNWYGSMGLSRLACLTHYESAVLLLHEWSEATSISFPLSISSVECGPLSTNLHKVFIALAEYAKASGAPPFASLPCQRGTFFCRKRLVCWALPPANWVSAWLQEANTQTFSVNGEKSTSKILMQILAKFCKHLFIFPLT